MPNPRPTTASLQTLLVLVFATASGGCALTQKKIVPKATYRAGYVGSTDGAVYYSVLELMEKAEKSKSSCLALDRSTQIKAQYQVERAASGAIRIKIKECESISGENCRMLAHCLNTRPVPWLTRSSGRTPHHAGAGYTDWLGRCGGLIAVNFYLGPQATLPVEKVGCAEPVHDSVDTAPELFVLSRPNTESMPSASAAIEALLRRWNSLVFSAVDPPPIPKR